MTVSRTHALIASVVLAAGAATAAIAAPASVAAPAGSGVTTRVIHPAGHTRLTNGSIEIGPQAGPDAANTSGPVANRSEASRARATRGTVGLSGIPASSSAVTSTGAVTASFDGIDHFDQRYVSNGNQFSLEPPDQALCVGNGYAVEAVNDAIAVYDSSGSRVALDSLSHFYGYPPSFDRTNVVFGPEPTDPTCLFDPGTGRFFVTMLTLFTDPATGNFTGVTTLDTAVSSSGNPATATWSITHIDATDDGTNGTPTHPGCPCIGDYPHIGVDANGYYISTNEYPFFTDGYNGAQIYAMSKSALATGADAVTVTQFDTGRAAPGGRPGFTIWPAQSPATSDYASTAGGTEYFLSTDAAPEANGTGSSTNLLTWSLTNTSALLSGRAPLLHVTSSTVGKYALPPVANQKAGPTPLADCLNLTACAKFVLGTPDKYKESESTLDPLDSRMQQVTYAGGRLFGSHGTALDPAGDTQQRAGVAWYVTNPVTAGNGNLSTTVLGQGRLGVAGHNLMDPALGVRSNGTAVIGVTLAGTAYYPSASYVDLVGGTTGAVHVIAPGAGPEDGFTGYRIEGGTTSRWGDYGAAALDPTTGKLWVANEYIGQTCTFSQYVASPFGQCGGTRTALANWDTRISRIG